MAFIDLVTEDVIKHPLTSTNKPDVIRELIAVLRDAGRIEETEKAYDAIMNRESLGSTGLEYGIAVPHAKCEAVTSLTLAIGVSLLGIDFDAIDGKPSHLFFLMLAAPDQSGPHLEALSEIARMTRSKSFINMLISSSSAAEIVRSFREE